MIFGGRVWFDALAASARRFLFLRRAAMLIIPAAAARTLARTPESMALFAALIGAASAAVGLQAALIFDTPAGPSIVCVAAILFALLNLWRKGQGARS